MPQPNARVKDRVGLYLCRRRRRRHHHHRHLAAISPSRHLAISPSRHLAISRKKFNFLVEEKAFPPSSRRRRHPLRQGEDILFTVAAAFRVPPCYAS
ncbi:MAG: hypothetical protein WC483_00245 [Candidatus Paceibacterota bacterium]